MPTQTRQFWFRAMKVYRLLKQGEKVTVPRLAEALETSRSSVRRLLDALRDDFHMPLAYDRGTGSWVLEDPTWEPPVLDLSPEELTSFCLAYSLLDGFPKRFASAIESFRTKLVLELGRSGTGLALLDRVSVRQPSWAEVDRDVLREVLRALCLEQRLAFVYTSPWKGERTERVVDPKHLLLYEGNFFLVAHCHLRSELRLFNLSFVGEDSVRVLPEPADSEPVSVAEFLDGYGIMAGGRRRRVTVRIAGPAALRARVEEWHPEQRDQWNEKRMVLKRTFFVHGWQEVKRLVLSYGSALEVVSPKALREEVAAEVRKMAALYDRDIRSPA